MISAKNWGQIALHGIGGAAFVGVALKFPVVLPFFNAAFWIWRELQQRKIKGQHWTHTFTDLQVCLEWGAPVVSGFGIWAVFRMAA